MNPRIYQRINRNVVPKTAIEWVLVLGILGMLGWMVIDLVQCELESRRGSAEARFDIAKADFKCRLRGKAHGWDKDAIEIAKQDFGIRVIRTGGCTGSGPDCSYDSAYNRVIHEHFVLKLGFDPIHKSFDMARTNWLERHDFVATAPEITTPQVSDQPKSIANPNSGGVQSEPTQ